MGKKIIVLNGSPRRGGNTAALVDRFLQGAKEAGHQVTRFDLRDMEIHPCLGCYGGGKDLNSPCVQKDAMDEIYPVYREADVVIFASPMYFWTISGQLKCALDRLFATAEGYPDYRVPWPRRARRMTILSPSSTITSRWSSICGGGILAVSSLRAWRR